MQSCLQVATLNAKPPEQASIWCSGNKSHNFGSYPLISLCKQHPRVQSVWHIWRVQTAKIHVSTADHRTSWSIIVHWSCSTNYSLRHAVGQPPSDSDLYITSDSTCEASTDGGQTQARGEDPMPMERNDLLVPRTNRKNKTTHHQNKLYASARFSQ